MAGTWPTSPGFMAVNFRSNHASLMSQSVALNSDVFDMGGQRWEFTARYNNMTYTNFMPIFAFAMAQSGGAETFTITLPEISDNQGTASGAITINGAHSAGASAITLNSFSGQLIAGSFFKIAGHNKVYMTTADRAGAGSVAIYPDLQQALAGGEAVTYDGVDFTARLSSNIHMFDLGLPNIPANYEIDFIEVV